jgi:hypothetical protein
MSDRYFASEERWEETNQLERWMAVLMGGLFGKGSGPNFLIYQSLAPRGLIPGACFPLLSITSPLIPYLITA